MDGLVEKVILAMGDIDERPHSQIARAAIEAVLDALEPVAWCRTGPRTGLRVFFESDPTRSGPATPLYDLTSIKDALK